jgi:hypothetical protein
MRAKDVRSLIEQGEYKRALRGAKDFRIGISREQRDAMARGYEAMLYPDFYKSVGKDPQSCIQLGIEVLKEVMTLPVEAVGV